APPSPSRLGYLGVRTASWPPPHPALSPFGGEGAKRIPLPRRGRGPQFELKGAALRRELNRPGWRCLANSSGSSVLDVAEVERVGQRLEQAVEARPHRLVIFPRHRAPRVEDLEDVGGQAGVPGL